MPSRAPLPQVLEIDLGQGDVVAVEPVLEAVQDAPLVLEGAGVREEQLERQDADDHGQPSRAVDGLDFFADERLDESPGWRSLKPPTPMPHS